MPVAPTGHFSLPLSRLRATLAESSTFQTWTGSGSVATALALIFVGHVDATTARPFAVVEQPKQVSRALGGNFDNNLMEARFDCILRFRSAAIVGGTSTQDAFYTFENMLGGVAGDLETLAGTILTDGLESFKLESVELAQQPQRPEEDEAKTSEDYYEGALRCRFRGPSP